MNGFKLLAIVLIFGTRSHPLAPARTRPSSVLNPLTLSGGDGGHRCKGPHLFLKTDQRDHWRAHSREFDFCLTNLHDAEVHALGEKRLPFGSEWIETVEIWQAWLYRAVRCLVCQDSPWLRCPFFRRISRWHRVDLCQFYRWRLRGLVALSW